MDIRISATLGWARIFNGQLQSTVECQLALSGKYVLIYAELGQSEPTAALDIFSLLNVAFGTHLPIGKILVQDAGFYTFNHTGPGAPGHDTLHTIFPSSPIPEKVAAKTTTMLEGCGFWLSVDIKSVYLFDSLIQIGVHPQSDDGYRLSLSANLASGTQAGTALTTASYSVQLPDITLFNLFSFTNVSLSYRFDRYSNLNIHGDVAVNLFDQTYGFTGALVSDGEAGTVTAFLSSSQAGVTIPALFGGDMRGISFSNLMLGLDYTLSKAKDTQPRGRSLVQGRVGIGGTEFTGQIYLEGSTPVVASVMIDTPLSIGSIFTQCLPGLSWPTDLIDITFQQGSQLYYSRGTPGATLSSDTFSCPAQCFSGPVPPAAPIEYRAGFNIHAVFDLTLIETVELIGDVRIARDGVTASITLAKPIGLFVLTIAAPDASPASSGPTLTFSTVNGSSMGFAGSLWFFQKDFGLSVTVQARKNALGNLEVNGDLKSMTDFSPVLPANTELGFSYSKDGGFRITHWPDFEYENQVIDFVKELKKLYDSGSGVCGALTDLASNYVLSSKFSISPSFSTANGGLFLNIHGTYSLFVARIQFTQLDFPSILSIPLPDSVSLDDLPNMIGGALAAAGQSFVQGLISNKKAIANFIGLMGGQKAFAYAAQLACRKLIDGLTADAAQEAASAAAAAGGGAAAAVAAAAAAVAHALGGGGGGGGGGDSQSPPSDVTASYANATVTLRWRLGTGNNRYQTEMIGPNQTDQFGSASLGVDSTSDTFSFAPDLATGRYLWRVRGLMNEAATDWVSLARIYLAAPVGLSARADPTDEGSDCVMTLHWTAVLEATAYTLTVTPNGQQARVIAITAPSDPVAPTTYRLSFGPSDPAGVYTLTLSASGGADTFASVSGTPLTLTRLAAPQAVQGTSLANVITLTWSSVSDAASYQALITAADGLGRLQALSADPDGARLTASITLPIGSTGRYVIAVRALPAADTSAWVPSPVSAPAVVSVLAYGDATAMAAALFSQAVAGAACGPALLAAFPTLTVDTLAQAMATAGYAAQDTAKGLLTAWPQTSPADFAHALLTAYPPAPSTPEQLASRQRARNVSGAACVTALLTAFPSLQPIAVAQAMAAVGYPYSDTGGGLKAALPALTDLQMAQALVAAYSQSE